MYFLNIFGSLTVAPHITGNILNGKFDVYGMTSTQMFAAIILFIIIVSGLLFYSIHEHYKYKNLEKSLHNKKSYQNKDAN